ncbi:MAG: formamidopyrimidine-DNA glycosylase [Pelagibacteraceae bacterium]|nr:formamidopyrimidine-DNA glycosylase [Pelagibacteraceae bacterium]
MPELPEVETTVRDLNFIKNLIIKKINLYRKDIRYPIPKKIIKISKNQKILKTYRIGKYIIINLDNLYSIVIHLGMSGRLKLLNRNQKPDKHDHVELLLSNNQKIIFNDPRRFGLIDILKTPFLKNSKYFLNQGIDPFDKMFNANYLYKRISNSQSNIKAIIMNQKIILGIGNIYASEILFDSKISPLKRGRRINKGEAIKLLRSIKKILLKAINNKGSTLRDYSRIYGTLGNYQNIFKVYNKEGDYILINKMRGKIIRITQNGRSTFYCPLFQK